MGQTKRDIAIILRRKKKFIVSGVEKDGSGDTGNNIINAKSKTEALQITRKHFPSLIKLKAKRCGC